MKDHTLGSYFKELKDEVTGYVEARAEYARLTAYEKTAKGASRLTFVLVMALLGFFTLFFISIATAVFLSEQLGSYMKGFGIIAGFYVLLTLLIAVFRKKIFDEQLADTLVGTFLEEAEKRAHEKSGETTA